jgi:hypothetical protein
MYFLGCSPGTGQQILLFICQIISYFSQQSRLPAASCNLSYPSKIIDYLYHQWVSTPLKKRPDMLSDGNVALPVGCDSLLQIVMAVWRSFCLNLNFLGRV